MSQTGALKFKNAMDCGANRSGVEGEGQGARRGNGEEEENILVGDSLCNN